MWKSFIWFWALFESGIAKEILSNSENKQIFMLFHASFIISYNTRLTYNPFQISFKLVIKMKWKTLKNSLSLPSMPNNHISCSDLAVNFNNNKFSLACAKRFAGKGKLYSFPTIKEMFFLDFPLPSHICAMLLNWYSH